jgi:hypothetical protein
MSEQMPLMLDQIGERRRRSSIDIWKKEKEKKANTYGTGTKR